MAVSLSHAEHVEYRRARDQLRQSFSAAVRERFERHLVRATKKTQVRGHTRSPVGATPRGRGCQVGAVDRRLSARRPPLGVTLEEATPLRCGEPSMHPEALTGLLEHQDVSQTLTPYRTPLADRSRQRQRARVGREEEFRRPSAAGARPPTPRARSDRQVGLGCDGRRHRSGWQDGATAARWPPGGRTDVRGPVGVPGTVSGGFHVLRKGLDGPEHRPSRCVLVESSRPGGGWRNPARVDQRGSPHHAPLVAVDKLQGWMRGRGSSSAHRMGP